MRMVELRAVDSFTLEENGAVLQQLHGVAAAVIPPPYQGGG